MEALTSFDENNQIRIGWKFQRGEPVILNSKTLKSTMPASNNRGWSKRANFHEEMTRSSEANKDPEGEEKVKTKKSLHSQQFSMEIQEQNIRLKMKASYRRRTKCTIRQAEALVLERVQSAECTRGSRTIDMSIVIQFRTDKY